MHPDPLDTATEQEMRMAAAAEADQRAKCRPEQVRNLDGTWPHTECICCGGVLEPGRLALGKVRCFLCQSDKESREKRGLR